MVPPSCALRLGAPGAPERGGGGIPNRERRARIPPKSTGKATGDFPDRKGTKRMDGKKGLLFLIFFILVVDIFWNGALRTIALHRPDSPWAKALLYSK